MGDRGAYPGKELPLSGLAKSTATGQETGPHRAELSNVPAPPNSSSQPPLSHDIPATTSSASKSQNTAHESAAGALAIRSFGATGGWTPESLVPSCSAISPSGGIARRSEAPTYRFPFPPPKTLEKVIAHGKAPPRTAVTDAHEHAPAERATGRNVAQAGANFDGGPGRSGGSNRPESLFGGGRVGSPQIKRIALPASTGHDGLRRGGGARSALVRDAEVQTHNSVQLAMPPARVASIAGELPPPAACAFGGWAGRSLGAC